MKRLTFPLDRPQVKRYEGKETRKEIEEQIEQQVLKATIDTEEVLFLLKPLLEPLIHEMDRMRLGLKELVDDLHKARTWYDVSPAISNSVAYEVAYFHYKYLFIYSVQAFTLATNSGSTISIPANQWVNISLPRGTKITAQGIADSAPIPVLIRASDELLSLAGVGGALGTVNQGSPPWSVSQSGTWTVQIGNELTANGGNGVAVGTYSRTPFSNNQTSNANFTSSDIPVGDLATLNVDIVFGGFTGGTTPTITYNISRKDAFGNYNLIWTSTAKSAAFSTFLTIGAGAQQGSAAGANVASVGVDFGDIIQVSWTITGAPTSITQATTIKGKSW